MTEVRAGVRWTWSVCEPPLEPSAVIAIGPIARELGLVLMGRSDPQLQALRGVAGEDVLLLLGAAADLPWIDGAVYLGRDSSAPALLVPTTHRPSLPLPLIERAILSRRERLPAPVALTVNGLLVSGAEARPVSRPVLEAWLRPAALASNG